MVKLTGALAALPLPNVSPPLIFFLTNPLPLNPQNYTFAPKAQENPYC